MLTELVVSDLGVIETIAIVLGPGLTAVTGETGAGKTLIVEAIELLLGARADPTLVREGASEARVDGRFHDGSEEHVLSRVVPREGRSRAYFDGRPIPLSTLAEHGRRYVDLYGQHLHQSLLRPAAQRRTLDSFGGIDTTVLAALKARLRDLDAQISALGGDARARARDLDLLRFQVDEIDKAAIAGDDEDERLEHEEEALADAVAHRDAAQSVLEALSSDDGARSALGAALSLLGSRRPFADLAARLRGAIAEVDDLSAELRTRLESMEEDPERLSDVRARRKLLRDLCKKYGDDLSSVLAFLDEARARRDDLESRDDRVEALEAERLQVIEALSAERARVMSARDAAGPRLAAVVETNLRELAMPRAHVRVEVNDDGDGGEVTFLLAANAGTTPLPMAKVASGGELARAMLATRLAALGLDRDPVEPPGDARATSHDPDVDSGAEISRDDASGLAPGTLVFDEVDAGIGGTAALAVGRALAAVATERQVLVVTHLAQVAAYAGAQVLVSKGDDGRRTRTTARRLDGDERVIELSRMLSGQPDSETARSHARELLAAAVQPAAAMAGARPTTRARTERRPATGPASERRR